MRSQAGQALALVALMLTILVGMVAIAIDGARAYAERRDLQAAVDAAALAAGDKLQQGGGYPAAERAATTVFATNLRLYATPSCSVPYGAPGAAPLTITCTFSDSTALTQVVSALGAQGSQFALTASRPLVLQFASILTNGASPTLAAAASGSVNNQVYSGAVTALAQAGCGGAPSSAVVVSGGGTLNVIGDVVSAGGIDVSGGAMNISGDIYARCQATVPGSTLGCYPSGTAAPCFYPNVAGATRTGFHPVDPNYPVPAVTGSSQVPPATDVVLMPGLYTADPSFNSSRCYFLSGGVYEWQGGYSNAGGFVSNELKPPDEPVYNNRTALGHQMWNTGGVNCAGAFQLSATSGAAISREGTWAIELTATRTETYGGIDYKRESAPSMCRTVFVGDAAAIKIQVSNVPGATGYNVYASPPASGCSGPPFGFGFAGSITVPAGTEHNDNTSGCAFSGPTCTLGMQTAVVDGAVLTSTFAANAMVAPGVIGATPPGGETAPLRTNLPNQNPDRGTPPAGDRANENQCNTVVGAASTCPGQITPGAVEFYIPSTGCLNATTGGDNFLFSGYQYNWVLVYEPGAGNPPANQCPNMLGAAADSAWVGLIYMPRASLEVSKAATFRTEATGGLMADTIKFSGQLPTIIYSSSYAPQPPASRLVY